jgi:hypothetical protein
MSSVDQQHDCVHSPGDDLYPAYLTTEATDEERIPISGERIVIVLGEDDAGRPIELSIVLKKNQCRPGRIAMYAIYEQAMDERRFRLIPIPVIEPCRCVNVFQISIKHEAWGKSNPTDPA